MSRVYVCEDLPCRVILRIKRLLPKMQEQGWIYLWRSDAVERCRNSAMAQWRNGGVKRNGTVAPLRSGAVAE